MEKVVLTEKDIEALKDYMNTKVREDPIEDHKVKELLIYKLELADAVNKAHDLEVNCPHSIQKSNQIRDCTTGYCTICGYDFGWWCPTSPDNVCYYYSNWEDHTITLVDGTTVQTPEGHDQDYETEDQCIFCSLPEERK